MNPRSIQARLILWYTALALACSAGFGVYTYYSVNDRLYAEMRTTLERRVRYVGADIVPHLDRLSPQGLAQLISEIYSPAANNYFIRISRADGTVLYVSRMPRDGAFNPEAVPPATHYPNHVAARTEHTGKSDLLVVGLDVHAKGRNYIVEMGAPTDQARVALRRLIATLLIGLPFVTLAAVAGGWVLIGRALRPVEILRAGAEKITFSNLSHRLPVEPTGDAIEHLSATLNRMLERLEQAYQQAARFSADASHELRTPLTVMRSELEALAASMRAQRLPAAMSDRIGSILEEAERLSRIVEGLLALARLDAGEAKSAHTPFDLAELVRTTVEQMQLLAEDKDIVLSIDAPQPVFVDGDMARLRQVVVNLLDNAIKYTPQGGGISFGIEAEAQTAILRVRDNGAGIAAEALPHIFERFYRADKARLAVPHGTGIGLSIVRAICQAHNGAATAESAEGEGTTITVRLPLTQKGAPDAPENKERNYAL